MGWAGSGRDGELRVSGFREHRFFKRCEYLQLLVMDGRVCACMQLGAVTCGLESRCLTDCRTAECQEVKKKAAWRYWREG